LNKYRTEQEESWAGEFGDAYIKRNEDLKNKYYKNNIPIFAKIFSHTTNVNSVLEFGSNIGLNLEAMRVLKPDLDLSAIEINATAVESLKEVAGVKIYHQSILDFEPDYPRDFVLIKGVIVHLNPDWLDKVYELMYASSKNYICFVEYYDPHPVEVFYHGYRDRLFKRDFAGEMMDKFPDLKLVEYGFVYHRDNNFPQDDVTWFLLQKS